MADDLIARIKAYRSAPDVYYAPDPADMEAHILADAEALKAADELALVVSGLLDVMQPHKMKMVVESALAAYRKARGET